MHLVVCRIVGLDRQEGACANMKGDELVVDTGISQPLHQLRRKVQRRRWRCNGSIARGKHGLVIACIALIRRASRRNVRWQRHHTEPRNGLIQKTAGLVEAQRNFAALSLGLDRGIQRDRRHWCQLMQQS
jgi:hypothetical protein